MSSFALPTQCAFPIRAQATSPRYPVTSQAALSSGSRLSYTRVLSSTLVRLSDTFPRRRFTLAPTCVQSPSRPSSVVPTWNGQTGKGAPPKGAGRKLVMLDRDGVVNKDLGTWVQAETDFELLPGAGEAIAMLNKAGHKVVVVSNQSCVGRGLITADQLDSIHNKMREELAHHGAHIDKIYCSFETPEAATERRKPGRGMIMEAMQDFSVPSGADCVFIGDTLGDMQAATAALVTQKVLVCSSGHGMTLVGDQLEEWGLHPPVCVLPPMGPFGGLTQDVLPVSIHKDLLSAVIEMMQGFKDEMDGEEAWVGDWSSDPAAYQLRSGY